MSEEKKTISATSLVAAIDAGLSVPAASEWIEARPDLHFSPPLVAQLCDRYVKSDRAFYQAETWLRQLADHEADPELASTIRSVLLRREVKNPDSKELTFKKVGSDIGGRDVLEVDGHTDLYGAAGAIAAYCKKLQVTRALLWNGIATLCFPGMTREEWIVENEIRRTAYQSGKWPQQLMPFSPEIDPFKITPVS